jgi:Rrf2 family protein
MTGEYAIRAMLRLASLLPGDSTQITEIASQWEIPENILRKIISQLAKAQLIFTQRGIGGGIRLAQPADKLTLLDIIEAVEGKIYLNKCLIGPDFCSRTSWCAVHLVWREAQQKMKEILSSKSLAELVAINDFRKSQVQSLSSSQANGLNNIESNYS